ncbi:Cytochrome c heme lyase subunit CcmH [hydrothermal vent metagenome]|uniref:Cytochrome c heme lyase subunit CcmH n=1 Tax=hydrothermal vent metagenome TaxID=652676 RepID=A0A1W1DBL0_9ZZZZ
MFDQAQDEITQTLAVELTQSSSGVGTVKNGSSIWLAGLSVVFISILSLGIYKALSPEVSTQVPALDTQIMSLSLEESVVKIQDHLLDKPNDADAWKMLGLTYFELNNLDESLKAYEKSYQLNQRNPRLLVEYASAIATKNDDSFSGRPMELIKQALELEPDAPDALYVAGMFAVSIQNFDLAKALWQRSLSSLPLDSPDRSVLTEVLAELSSFTGEGDPKTAYSVAVRVTFSDQILASRSKDDYVMIYIKAAQGRPMPIAIQKIQLKDFTGVVELTDDDSVMPTRKLSQSEEVIAVVRLSQSGSAMKQASDIQVLSKVINVRDNPTVNLQVE